MWCFACQADSCSRVQKWAGSRNVPMLPAPGTPGALRAPAPARAALTAGNTPSVSSGYLSVILQTTD